jgi:GNAT superfamily N-acetyltransferase
MTFLDFNATVLLRRPAQGTADTCLAEGQQLIELGAEDAQRISRCDRDHGRRGDLDRIRRRFAQGFRYFAITEAGAIVAWFWAVHGVPRYLDEMCWRFDLDEQHVWARDAFVVPRRRSSGLLRMMMNAACTVDARPAHYLSDVSFSNRISLRAHRSLGFEKIATVCSVAVGSRFLLRTRTPLCMPPINGLRPEKRVLWMSRDELLWHRQQIA